MKEKKDPTILKVFDSLSLVLLFPSIVTRAFPWPIKGKVGHPMKGIELSQTHQTLNRSEHDTSTRLSSNRALGTRSLLSLETWDMSLSRPFVTHTTNFSVLVTRVAAAKWM